MSMSNSDFVEEELFPLICSDSMGLKSVKQIEGHSWENLSENV